MVSKLHCARVLHHMIINCSRGISFSTEGSPKTDVIPLAGSEWKSLFPSFQEASEIPRHCWPRARAKIRHYPQNTMVLPQYTPRYHGIAMSVTAMRLTDSTYEVWLYLLNLHGAESPLFCIWCLWDGPFFSSFCCPVPVFQLKRRAPPRGQYFKSVKAMNYRERNSSYILKWYLYIRGTVIRAFRTRWPQYIPLFLIALVSLTEPVWLSSAPDFAEHW